MIMAKPSPIKRETGSPQGPDHRRRTSARVGRRILSATLSSTAAAAIIAGLWIVGTYEK